MDCTHHDFLGLGHDAYQHGAQRASVLRGALLSWSRRGQLFPRNDCVSDPLVSAAGAGLGDCLPLLRPSCFLLDWLTHGRLAARGSLVWIVGMALVVYRRRNSCGCSRSGHSLLLDRSAVAGAVDAPRRTRMANP